MMTYDDLSSLIEPVELNALLGREDLVIIDTRDEAQYEKSHLPGAISLQEVFYYISLPENGGLEGIRARFTDLFGQVGIRPTDRVIFYEDAQDNGYGRSCRGWMLMQDLGHPRVQVLHGGFRGWVSSHFPTTQEVPHPQPTVFQAHLTPGHLIGRDETLAALSDPSSTLVDCRDYAEWLGANSSPYGYNYCPRKGRIPGSVWVEWYRLIRHNGGVAWFESPEAIRQLCETAGILPQQRIVVYCFKGARASAVVLALRRSGYTNVVNYFPSWNEWSRDFSCPVDEDYPLT